MSERGDGAVELVRVTRGALQDNLHRGAAVVVDDDGKVFISSTNSESVDAAKVMVEAISAVPEVGKTYHARVVRIMPNLGAFVQFMPGKDGLVHISQLDHKRVERVEDVVHEGDEFDVKVLEVDSQGRVNLSRKALLPLPEGMTLEESQRHSERPHHSSRPPFRGGGDRNRGRHGSEPRPPRRRPTA